MKEKQCKNYCGVTCVNGQCPIALYNDEDPIIFGGLKPKCDNCFHYKGCEDCYFKNTNYCNKEIKEN